MAQLLETGLGLPAQNGFGLGRIADEQLDFGGPVKLGVDTHDRFAGGHIDSRFVFGFAFEFQLHIDGFEGHADKISNRFGAVGGQHKRVGFCSLQHAPHALHILFGKAPIALGIDVAKLDAIELTQFDFGHAVGDFARHKFATPQGAFVVEQNAAAAKIP